MFKRLQQSWQRLRSAPPGQRFQRGYDHARQRRQKGGSGGSRLLRLALACALLLVGVVLVFIPGPAILFFAVAGALLSTESRRLARLLDAAEVGGRRVLRTMKTAWRRAGRAAQIAMIGGAVVAGLAVGWAAFFLARRWLS